MNEVLFGGILLTALLGGLVALLAPCCVSVMLPAYLSAGFRRRTGVLAATLIFALGVATVIVPISLGATALLALVTEQHALVFTLAATAMLVGGVAMLLGWKPRLPMIPGRAPTGNGFGSVYGLGVFSGVASSCCAPVLAGIVILSGTTASFPAALAVSFTYVVGMVAPLAVFALLWERKDWRARKWLNQRQVTLRLGPVARTMTFGTAASAFLLIVIAALTYIQAAVGPGMGADGWLLQITADLQHVASVGATALSWVPGWAIAAVLVVGTAFIIWQAHRNSARAESSADETSDTDAPNDDAHVGQTSPTPPIRTGEDNR